MKRLSRADILIMFGYTAGTKLYNLLYSSCANFCCIVKNCLGISSLGNAGLVLNQQGDWITAGGGGGVTQIVAGTNVTISPGGGTGVVTIDATPIVGSQNLSSVLIQGNASGANDINFDTLQGLYFANTSRLREGTIDAGLGGNKGIAQICAVGYELKWEAGRLYVMDGNGTGIRQSLYNLIISPTVNDDNTKGYGIGSLWTLDDNSTYECTDATTGSAVWVLQTVTIPIEIQVAASDEFTPLIPGVSKVTFRLPTAFTLTEVRASLTIDQTGGPIFTVDINQNGTSILGTLLTIDNFQKTSTTASVPATIVTSSLTDDAEITVDIDQIGGGTAAGLKITLIGTR